MNSQQELASTVYKKEKTNKVVIIGDSNVGKTCIIERFTDDKFGDTQPTIGALHKIKTVKDVQLDIWDTAGQERFKSMVPMYYKGAKAIIVTFDVTNLQSFEGAKKWMNEIENNIANILILLLANKIDLVDKRVVSYEVAKSFADEKKFFYFETSAKENINIKESFLFISEKIQEMNIQYERGKSLAETRMDKNNEEKYGGHCNSCTQSG